MIGAAGANYPPLYNASFESIYAAMCRGEIPANINMPAGSLGPNPTLLQAISQGQPQNGTNGIGVTSGYQPGVGAGFPVVGTSFGNPPIVDGKQMANVPTLANPIQYSGA
jgi:hypothetical protein